MSYDYNLYIQEHINNVMKAGLWIVNHVDIPADMLPPDYSEDLLMEILSMHDRSKYEQSEYPAYDEYFYRKELPMEISRKAFDMAWLEHIRRNPHHWQHWVLINDDDGTYGIDMPFYYVIEMISDWMSFAIKEDNPYEFIHWYNDRKDKMILSEKTRALVDEIVHKCELLFDAGVDFHDRGC